ncbi:MAG: UDP-N-acetyl glucosamine 2-epimerase, partial [Inhella sp.]|uniref:UDP-N-acetyl glucosamine 2-epimerase n=1 Tax=Inhella sp. TaxID=1921806 RepID=UPI00391F53EA
MARPLLHLVAGARPNFMKIAPLVRALQADGRLDFQIVHTGQHFDRDMNEVFFEELGIPQPDVRLGCGGGSHAEQTGKIMQAYEQLIATAKPACCLVVGDVNSTLACAIVAKKAGVPVAHVEAGLRSGDMSMPEELNRLVTDALADLLLTPSADGDANLRREGAAEEKIRCVGNVMIDSLVAQLAQADATDTLERLGLEAG